MKSKLLFIFFIIGFKLLSFGQDDVNLYQQDLLHFYSSYNNIIHWDDFDNCDSTTVTIQGALFVKTGDNSGIVKVSRGTILTKVFLNGYSNNQIIVIDSFEVSASPIPTPNIYIKTEYPILEKIEEYGLQHLHSDIIRDWKGFVIKRDRYCPIQFEYEIVKWSISVNDEAYSGTGHELSEELIFRLNNLSPNDKVNLYSIQYSIPSISYFKTLIINSEFIIN